MEFEDIVCRESVFARYEWLGIEDMKKKARIERSRRWKDGFLN